MRISDWSSDVCSSDLNAARLLKETGAAAVKVEGGKVLAPTIEFLTQRGIPVMGHVGLTPQAVNILGGYGVRGKSEEEARSIVEDAVRSEESRGGKEWVSTFSSRWSPYHKTKKKYSKTNNS